MTGVAIVGAMTRERKKETRYVFIYKDKYDVYREWKAGIGGLGGSTAKDAMCK
jgi:hypothetical protein